MKPTLRPVDILLAAWNAAMSAIWLVLAPGSGAGALLAGVHLAAAILPLGLLSRRARWRDLLATAYPLPVIGLAWSELGLLRRLVPDAGHDALVSAMDGALFGSHPHETWMTAMPEAWYAELWFGIYLGYYLLVFGLPIGLALARRRDAFDDAVFRLLVTYLACDLVYALFPVYGPRHAAGALPETATFLGGVAESLRASGDSPGTAFPSSHVAGVVTAAVIAWRWLPRPAARAWCGGAALVALSTIYTRNHYAVDAFAGALLALALQAVLVPALERLRAPAGARTPSPFPCVLRALPENARRVGRNLP